VGRRCLPLKRPGTGVYICESEAVRDKYSTGKVSWRGRSEKTHVKMLLPATDSRSDVDGGNSGVRNPKMLLNHSRMRESERVDDEGDEGEATFAVKV